MGGTIKAAVSDNVISIFWLKKNLYYCSNETNFFYLLSINIY